LYLDGGRYFPLPGFHLESVHASQKPSKRRIPGNRPQYPRHVHLILYLSLYFKSNRAAYDELLDRVRTKGDWEAWLDFFLIGVRDTADHAANAARRILALFAQDQKKIEALGRPAASVLRVLQHMQRNPIVAIPTTARKIGISAPTVTKSLMHMIDLGILHEVTGRERHRLFVCRPI
jgi:Fic family protein